MQTETAEMPKTYREQLATVNEVGKGFKIDPDKRISWANFLSTRFHKTSNKKFTIRETPGTGEVWVYLKEIKEAA